MIQDKWRRQFSCLKPQSLRIWVGFSGILLVLLIGCTKSEEETLLPDPVALEAGYTLYFPTQQENNSALGGATMSAEITGTLRLMGECLRLIPEGGTPHYAIVWPPNFSVRANADNLEIQNASGAIVAQVNDIVTMDGGETKTLEGVRAVSRLWQAEFPLKCEGPYWFVGKEVEHRP